MRLDEDLGMTYARAPLVSFPRESKRATTIMSDLIPPHGGLAEPVCRTIAEDEIDDFKAEAASLASVPVSAADLSSVYRFADGTLSPLIGPMDSATFNRVLDEQLIESNGGTYAWTTSVCTRLTASMVVIHVSDKKAVARIRNSTAPMGP